MSRLLEVACRSILTLVMSVAPLAAGPAGHQPLPTGNAPAAISSSVNEKPAITRLELLRDKEKREREAKLLDHGAPVAAAAEDNSEREALEDAGSTEFGLGDALLVTVKPWTSNATLEADKSAWILKINGIALPGVTAESISSKGSGKSGEAVFQFFLKTSESNRKEWDALLRYPLRGGGLKKSVRVGIQAPAGIEAITPKEADFIVISTKRLYPLAAFFVIVTVVLVVLARRSSILRGPRGLLYSLGRTQMAWWFVIILGSYLFLGISTFNWSSTIQPSALVLLGIAAGTALGSVMIDGDKDKKAEEANVQRETLPERMRAVEQLLVQRSATAADVAGLTSTLVEMQGQLNKANAAARAPDRSTKNFLMDLISDGRGVSLHRFQNVVWTFVLGGVYVFSVGTELSMPEFNATLLSLMGISSGTYVAFKFPEK